MIGGCRRRRRSTRCRSHICLLCSSICFCTFFRFISYFRIDHTRNVSFSLICSAIDLLFALVFSFFFCQYRVLSHRFFLSFAHTYFCTFQKVFVCVFDGFVCFSLKLFFQSGKLMNFFTEIFRVGFKEICSHFFQRGNSSSFHDLVFSVNEISRFCFF